MIAVAAIMASGSLTGYFFRKSIHLLITILSISITSAKAIKSSDDFVTFL
jgi:hypothetical protein